MIIHTKFNIGDKVQFQNVVDRKELTFKGIIKKIKTYTNEKQQKVVYEVEAYGYTYDVDEYELQIIT